jgi:ribonucleoside-triphosphate reductase
MSVQFVKDDFVRRVVNRNPQPLTELGQFVFYRTYSRWLPSKGRREFWHETCQRSVNYNVELAYKHMKSIGFQPNVKELRREAESLFSNMYETKQFLSGRTLWVGGAENNLAEKYPMSNYNCSFLNTEEWKDLGYLFYLLMIGTGVGFKTTKKMAKNLPKIRNNVKLIHSNYEPLPKSMRLEHAKLTVLENGYAKIFVGDSKEGWVESLNIFLKLLTEEEYEHVHSIKINYNSVRPRGERLVTFGGSASGHTSLEQMFLGFDNVLKNKIDESLETPEVVQVGYSRNAIQHIEGYEPVYVKLRPIHLMDMGNLIGANVVVGGVENRLAPR